MKKSLLAALILSGFTAPAFADNAGKYYIGGDIGSATWSGATITINGALNTFPNPGVVALNGGYRLSSNLAVELGYHSIGDSILTGTSGDVTLSSKSVTVSAVGSYPLNPQFDLLGKVGFASNSYTESTTGTLTFAGGGTSVSGSSSGVNWGVGANYHLNDKVGLRAMYESLGNFASGVSMSTVTLGATYDF